MLTIWESNPAHWWQARVSQTLPFLQIYWKMGLVLKTTKFEHFTSLLWYYKRLLLVTQCQCAWTLLMISLVITASVVETTQQKWTKQYIIWSSQIAMYHRLMPASQITATFICKTCKVCVHQYLNQLWKEILFEPVNSSPHCSVYIINVYLIAL